MSSSSVAAGPPGPDGSQLVGPAAPRPDRIRVLFGSETGNAETVAGELAAAAGQRGVEVSLDMLDDATPEQLADGGWILVVTATTGEGDMPYNAERFWRALSDPSAPRLAGVPFAVLGLGDTGYYDFCQAAEDLDARLEQLGAHRLRPLVKCDIDFEEEAQNWANGILAQLDPTAGTAEEPASAPIEDHSRHRCHPVTIRRSRPLTGPGSLKEVRHVELSIDDGELTYRSGDSVGVLPRNDPALVEHLLTHLHALGDEDADGRALREALSTDYEISRPSRDLVEEVGRRTEDRELSTLLAGDDRDALHRYLWARDILDLLRLATRPRLDTVEQLLPLLRPLARRSYSISSSPLVSPDRLDLTVASLRYRSDGRQRGGVCSIHLAERVHEGETTSVTLEPNEMFRPPTDGDAAMIMVGPGTGVAPFRAFLHERRVTGARGANWLFFGGRHRDRDLLYGDELTEMERDGHLTRLDLAFSREQAEKIYVQTRMREQGKQLYGWLRDGAHFYVCGDAQHMAGDVDHALHEIVAEHGGLSEDGAADYVDELKRDKRYLRDVY